MIRITKDIYISQIEKMDALDKRAKRIDGSIQNVFQLSERQ